MNKTHKTPESVIAPCEPTLSDDEVSNAMANISVAIDNAIEHTVVEGLTVDHVMGALFSVAIEIIESRSPGHDQAAIGAQVAHNLDRYLNAIGYGHSEGRVGRG